MEKVNNDNLRQKTISGFAYKFAERVGAQGIKFIISLILARLLLPSEYGVVALVTVFITICDVFVTYGFGNSLIANKNSDQLDFSTCFFFGIAFSIIVYIGVFFFAPVLAKFYDNELLTPVVRVMGLRVPLAAINSVQHAYVSKHMAFKKFFYSTLIGTIVSGVIAVIMAYNGFGVWALVEQYLGNVCMDTFFLWIIVGWRPSFVFSWSRLKIIYEYGWKILVVGLINTGYQQIRSLVIGKRYSSSDLAFYNKGIQFPSLPMELVEPTVNTVLFPALSHCSDDINQMKLITRRMIKISTFLISPAMIGLAVVAKPLIIVLLTEKWLDSVVFLQIGCVALLARPLQFINNSLIKASGRSGLLLKLDIIKKVIGVALLIISIPFGVKWIALSLLATDWISTFINIYPNRKIIGYGYGEQFKDLLMSLLPALIMGVIVYFCSFIPLPAIIVLVLQIFIGILVYICISAITKNDSFYYILRYLRELKSKFKKKTLSE